MNTMPQRDIVDGVTNFKSVISKILIFISFSSPNNFFCNIKHYQYHSKNASSGTNAEIKLRIPVKEIECVSTKIVRKTIICRTLWFIESVFQKCIQLIILFNTLYC
jgi:hypothetical protein